MYRAKSGEEGKTIQEHTDDLISNFQILKNLYEEDINVNWDVLRYACLYHDLGKTHRSFQNMIRGRKDQYIIPHGYLSSCFIDFKKFKDELGYEETIMLINSVFHHHYRGYVGSEIFKTLEKEIETLKDDANKFEYERLKGVKDEINLKALRGVKGNPLMQFSEEERNQYIMTKGLLNRIDYAASGQMEVEKRNYFLMDDLNKFKKSWGEDADFNDLQKFMIENQEENVIAVAETGYGKTEAGLLWIGDNKGFFVLPIRTAINSIYDRIRKDIVKDQVENKVALLHSDSRGEYLYRSNMNGSNRLSLAEEELLDYDERGRQLTLPLNICTLDQIFDFVYKYQGFEPKLATLSYSKIVIDEIQMYGPDLIAYLVEGLKIISDMGGKFSVITATLPPFIVDLFREKEIPFIEPKKPYLKEGRIRHHIELKEEGINGEFIKEKYKDNKILVITNTVKKAQELYEELEDGLGHEVNVFHSGYIKRDRRNKEEEIIEFGKSGNGKQGIWVCTQVAEASLDIDFDILITELSDLNGLFQRMGRCYRNREIDKDEPNIYVFDGGEEKTSGIPYVIDRDIFEYSKAGLREYMGKDTSKKISEEDKLALIDRVYTSENLKDSNYMKEIYGIMEYIQNIFYGEKDKSEVKKEFRNINAIDVIPIDIYRENKEGIEGAISILGEPYSEEGRIKKVEARNYLSGLTVSIPYYYTNDRNLESYDISRYEQINIYDCEYTKERGIIHKIETFKKEENPKKNHLDLEKEIEETELFVF